jgi:hypothetical protein
MLSGSSSTTITPKHGGAGDGGRHILSRCADHRRHCGDGGIAADGIAAGNQRYHQVRQAEQPPDGVAGTDRHHHHAGNAGQKPRAGGDQGPQTHGGAEHPHGHLQQKPRADIDARAKPTAWRPDAAQRGAEQNSEHERLQLGALPDHAFGMLENHGHYGNRTTEQYARQQGGRSPAARPRGRGRIPAEMCCCGGKNDEMSFRMEGTWADISHRSNILFRSN